MRFAFVTQVSTNLDLKPLDKRRNRPYIRGMEDDMSTTMNTPRAEQGQMIVPSYGWRNGQYYMRVHDRSDGAVEWFRAENRDEIPDEYDAGGYDDPPPVSAWISCEEPADDEDE